MLQRAARRVAALSEEKLVSYGNTLTDPFSLYLPCDYCTTLLRNESDRSRHIVLAPACLEAHRQAMQRKRNALPTVEEEEDCLRMPTSEPTIYPTSQHETIPSPPSSPNQPAPEPVPAESPPSPSYPKRDFIEEPCALPNDGAYIYQFPGELAGMPISADKTYLQDPREYLESCGTLGDPDVFEIAELLMRPGLTNAVRNDLLKSKLYRGRTPWPNCQRMLADIDKLPHGPEWTLHTIVTKYGAEEHKNFLYGRNIIDIVRDLIGNRRFQHNMRYAPERHYTSKDRKSRVYGEMWTGNWWWRYQIILSRINSRATIAPLIIASDKTRVSMLLGGQEVYPVYATIGNISKSVRRKSSERATILLGYLPIDKFENIKSDSERARLRAELTHRSMEVLLAPLKAASKDGVDMWCADGRLRRVYPILAAFIGDWPKQNDMACTSQGSCPICQTAHKGRGDLKQRAPLRKATDTLTAIRAYFQYGRHLGELEDLKLKPWMPWWADLPYTNFHACITPDLLHQLHQGVFKHILAWVFTSIGTIVADGRFSAMPPAQGMRHFTNRVSKIRNWTGRESKEVMKQILPVIVGSSVNTDFVELVRSMLDFMYRAHASRMDDEDLAELEDSLATFHRLKDVLIESGLYKGAERFDGIPKLHMLSHYSHSIRELGTPDGFNSESPEHLHIIYAKKPYRASNKVKPKPQMLKWIQRQEAIRIHKAYLEECFGPYSEVAKEGEGEEEELEMEEEEEEEEEWHDEEAPEDIAVGVGRQEGDDDDETGRVVEGISGVRLGAEGGLDGAGDNSDNGDGHEDGHEVEAAGGSPEPNYPGPGVTSAKRSTCDVKGHKMGESYGTIDFIPALTNCLLSKLDIPDANTLISPHHSFPVWHKVYLRHSPLTFAPGEPPQCDVVRAHPSPTGHASGGVFDTVLFMDWPDKFGLQRYRAGRVRVIFQLPGHLRTAHPTKFVYLELFKEFAASPSPFHRMPATAPQFRHNGKRHTIVLPLTDIVMASHLAPQFKWLSPETRFNPSLDLLSLSPRVFLNPYYNYYTFLLLDHWRRLRARKQGGRG